MNPQDPANITLSSLLLSQNQTIYRNAMSILREIKKNQANNNIIHN